MSLVILPRNQLVGTSGVPRTGAEAYFYEPGTETPISVYTTSAYSVAHDSPVLALSGGIFPAIYVNPAVNATYKVVVKDSAGSTVYTNDDVPAQVMSQAEIGLALYPRTTAEISAGITPTDYAYPPGNVLRYGADSTGVASATSAFANAFTVGGAVTIPPGTYLLSTECAATITDLDITAYGATVNCSLADSGGFDSAIELTGSSTSRVTIRGLKLVYTGAASGESLYGIRTPTTTIASMHMEDVSVTGFRYYAGEILAAKHQYDNCNFSDNYHAGLYAGGTGAVVLVNGGIYSNNGNGSDNTTGYGIVMSAASSKINGGRYTDNDRYGIDCRRANNVVVDGAYVYNSGYVGIYAVNEDAEKDASNIKVVNCTVDMQSRSGSDMGIWVGASGSSITSSAGEILVQGNTVRNCVGEGIVVSTGTSGGFPRFINVSDNDITTTGDFAINIAGTLKPYAVIVSKNQIQDSTEIQVSTGQFATIVDNQFYFTNSPTRLIYCDADKGLIRGNIAVGTITSATTVELGSNCTTYFVGDNILGSYLRGSGTFDPSSLADGAGETTTLTAAGASVGDKVTVGFSNDLAGITVTAWVSSANTASIRFQNESGTNPNDLSSGTLRVSVTKEK